MLAWLCAVFGFARRAVSETEDGRITHAELTLGEGMIMLGSKGGGSPEFDRAQQLPSELGGTTQSPYLVVADADTVYARAKAAGGGIVIDIRDADDGGCGFSRRDPEGHLWTVGSHDPWRRPAG